MSEPAALRDGVSCPGAAARLGAAGLIAGGTAGLAIARAHG